MLMIQKMPIDRSFEFTLKKLPLWGMKDLDEGVNFEWPTKKIRYNAIRYSFTGDYSQVR